MSATKTRWFVWNPNGRVPHFEHSTTRNARLEAERLARQNPGQKFLVLQSVCEVVKDDVVWVEHEKPKEEQCEIPF